MRQADHSVPAFLGSTFSSVETSEFLVFRDDADDLDLDRTNVGDAEIEAVNVRDFLRQIALDRVHLGIWTNL